MRPMDTVTWFMTKASLQFSGYRIVFSRNDAGTMFLSISISMDRHIHKICLSYDTHKKGMNFDPTTLTKINPGWIIYLTCEM